MRSGFSEARLGRDSRRDEYISTGRVKPRSAPRGPNRYVLSCRVALSRRGRVDKGPLIKEECSGDSVVLFWTILGCYSGRGMTDDFSENCVHNKIYQYVFRVACAGLCALCQTPFKVRAGSISRRGRHPRQEEWWIQESCMACVATTFGFLRSLP